MSGAKLTEIAIIECQYICCYIYGLMLLLRDDWVVHIIPVELGIVQSECETGGFCEHCPEITVA